MNFLKKSCCSKIKISLVSLFLVLSMTLAPVQAPKAHALWGEFPQEIFGNVLTMLTNMINGLILGGLKTAAITSINAEVSSLVGGSASQDAKFITNWNDFLVVQPQENANISMNDYLSNTVGQGRSSMSGYIPANYEGFGDGSFGYGMTMNNNSAYLVEMAKSHTTERQEPTITYAGEDIADAGDNFANLILYLSGVNNQWSFDVNAQNKYNEFVVQEKEKATTKAIAGAGFAEAGDQVTIPGVLVKDAMANVQNLGNEMLAAARDPGELATAVVQSMLTKAIQNGIGQAGSIVRKEINSTESNLIQEANNQAIQSGVGSLFKN